MANIIENAWAFLERKAPDLLEIRLKPAIRVDPACIAGIMEERIRLCGRQPLCLLVLASRDTELDIAVLGMDHYQGNGSAEGLRAVAIFSETLVLETMARLYAAYFPPMFRFEVFNQEQSARDWIQEQVLELREAGQKA